MSKEIHHVELKEGVLHARLCHAQGVKLPFVVALSPGKINLTKDICTYALKSAAQQRISTAKVNFKRLCRVYANRWRSKEVIIDLGISMAIQIGRQQVMISSLPSYHAQTLEALFQQCLASEGISNIWSEDFDPYVICAMRANLFDVNLNEEILA